MFQNLGIEFDIQLSLSAGMEYRGNSINPSINNLHKSTSFSPQSLNIQLWTHLRGYKNLNMLMITFLHWQFMPFFPTYFCFVTIIIYLLQIFVSWFEIFIKNNHVGGEFCTGIFSECIKILTRLIFFSHVLNPQGL